MKFLTISGGKFEFSDDLWSEMKFLMLFGGKFDFSDDLWSKIKFLTIYGGKFEFSDDLWSKMKLSTVFGEKFKFFSIFGLEMIIFGWINIFLSFLVYDLSNYVEESNFFIDFQFFFDGKIQSKQFKVHFYMFKTCVENSSSRFILKKL